MPDTRRPAALAPARLAWRAEIGIASLAALAVVLVVLWEPIVFIRSRTLGPWDWLAQSSSLTHVEPDAPIKNPAMGDPVRQLVPWAELAREELGRGRMPLWNSLDGTGVPLLANFQSALFSPFTWPFYVLPLKLALLASAAGRLFFATAGAYLLLRSLSRSRPASVVGAMGYGLCAFHMLCLLHPHVGVLALLPFGLLAVDRAARAFAELPTRLPIGWLAALSIALGLMVLAGHPETLLFSVYFVVALAAYHLARQAWLARGDRELMPRVARFACAVLVAGVVGGLLGAVQWMPFLEYLRASASLEIGERDVAPLSASYVLLQLFPNAAGTMRGNDWIPHGLVPGYHEVNAFYIGGTIALLALASSLFLRRNADMQFFLALGAGVLLYAFDAPLVSTLLGPVFGSHYVPAPRAAPLWVTSACVLAAFTLDQLRSAKRWQVFTLIALVLVAVAAARLGITGFWSGLAARDQPRLAELAPFLHAHVDAMSLAIVAGLVAVAMLAWVDRAAVRGLAWLVLFVVTAVHSAQPFHGYVPTVDDRFVLPRTPAIQQLAQTVGSERTVLLSSAGLQANTNVLYDVALITSYDAIEIRELDDLRAELFGYAGYSALTLQASLRGLDLFGVKYVGSRGDWVPIDTEHSHRGAPDAEGRWYIAGELGFPKKPRFAELDREHATLRQEFSASRDGLDGLVVHFSNDEAVLGARATLELFDVQSHASLARRSVRLGDLRAFPGGRLECVLAVPQIAGSKGHGYELEIRVDEFPPDAPVRVFRGLNIREGEQGDDETPANEKRRGQGGGKKQPGPVVLDMSYGRSDFERVGEVGDFVLYRYAPGLGRAWIVPGAIGVADAAAARERALAADFDPRSQVVIEGVASTPRVEGTFELARTSESAQSSRFHARCDAPAWLVLAQPHFPGWMARVNGAEVPLLRANYAFCAVALPAGASEVEIGYEPASFRAGWITSLAGCLVLCLGCAVARARR